MVTQWIDKNTKNFEIIGRNGTVRQDVSFGALATMTDGIARALGVRVARGDRVGVLLGQTPWRAAAHRAICKMVSIPVPLFKLFKHDALASRVRNAGLSMILTGPEGAQVQGNLAVPLRASDTGMAGGAVPCADVTPQSYTLVTTAAPKGSLHDHGARTGHVPAAALAHPSAVTIGVSGQPDAIRLRMGNACVLRKSGRVVTAKDLWKKIKERISNYCYKTIKTFDTPPMTVTGKVICKAFRAHATKEIGATA